MELPHSLGEFCPKLIGCRLRPKCKPLLIPETPDAHVAERPLPTRRFGPQVEHVMKIDVSQQRRSTSALGRTLLHTYPFPFLQHASVEPFLDQSHDAPVCNPMLHKLDKPFVGKPIEKAFDVKVEHPVHLSRQQSRVERVQRLMLASPRSEPVRKAEKIRLVDGVQHVDRRKLYDLVFKRRYSERSLPPVGLWYIHQIGRAHV